MREDADFQLKMKEDIVYEPAEDSFLLAEQVKKYAKGKVLDLGTGSGILAETALINTKEVLATDINEEAVKRLKQKGINARFSDLFSHITEKFNLIIFNPPYLPTERNEKPDYIPKFSLIFLTT